MTIFSFLIHLTLERNGQTVNQSAKSETKANVEAAGSVYLYAFIFLFYYFFM